MKRVLTWLIPALCLLTVLGVAEFLTLSAPASAAGRANPWAVRHASFDSRVCSGNWAFDEYTLRYQQLSGRDYVLHFDGGNYWTVAGKSPACTHHINALVHGSFTGYIKFHIDFGNLNPDTKCDVRTCTGDSILEGIQAFAKLTYGSSATETLGDSCFFYRGGDSDNDAGDAMQIASDGVSCSALGTGNQGDIYV